MVGEGSRYDSSAGRLQKSGLYPAHYAWLFSARLYLQGQKVSNHLLNYGKRERAFARHQEPLKDYLPAASKAINQPEKK